jgi:hypothetical protein
MDQDEAKEVSERDQLWASLRTLMPEIQRLAAGDFDGSERQQQMVMLISRIVVTEIDFRDRIADPEQPL